MKEYPKEYIYDFTHIEGVKCVVYTNNPNELEVMKKYKTRDMIPHLGGRNRK